MEYGINQLSKLSGVSARTLRYYHEIGLLNPSRVSESGYRYYDSREVDLLQQILFYRERGLPLNKITEFLYNQNFDSLSALNDHLKELEKQQEYITGLIRTVTDTINAMKGKITMNDKEKFEMLKQTAIQENEANYGAEIRKTYGEAAVDASNHKMMNLSQEDYMRFQELEQEIRTQLNSAVAGGKLPTGEAGRQIASLHKEWLMFTWTQYTKKAHLGLTDMYLMDERFKAYYDSETEGCAQFLRDAVHHWLQ